MNSTDRPIANPIVVLREEFDDWAVLFNSDTADAVGTNPVGVAIWKLMDGTKSVADIAAVIRTRFLAVTDTVFKETVAFIDKLSENGFVGLELESK